MVNPAEREGSTHPLDERVWKRVEEQCSKNLKKGDFLIRDLFESFPIYARRINLARFLARYELFRVVKDLPGCVLECGVYRGAGLLTWAKLAEIFCTGDRTKKLSALIILKVRISSSKRWPRNVQTVQSGWRLEPLRIL